MHRVLAVVAMLLGAGCVTAAEQEHGRMSDAAAKAAAAIDRCSDRLVSSDAYQALQGKIPPVGAAPPPIAMQANTAKPTPREIETLYSLHEVGIAPCRAVALRALAQVHPVYVSIKTDQYTQFDALFLGLVQGQATWGDFARGYNQLNQSTAAKMKAAGEQIGRQLGQEHEYEVVQRTAAANALQQWSFQQQLLNNQRQLIQQRSAPTMTTCNYVGRNLNCTTF